ncbi:MAG: hypothetical protein NZT92_06980 [Abditibacteriales bacterium]|nr:hypothetical protein [Abditibacteriales bacterium]
MHSSSTVALDLHVQATYNGGQVVPVKLQDKSQPISPSPDDGRVTEQTEKGTPTGVNDRPAELVGKEEEVHLNSIPDDISVELPIVIPLHPKTTMRVIAKVRHQGRGKFNAIVNDALLLDEES